MGNLRSMGDNDVARVLICFTDLAGFTGVARALPLADLAGLLKDVKATVAAHVRDIGTGR